MPQQPPTCLPVWRLLLGTAAPTQAWARVPAAALVVCAASSAPAPAPLRQLGLLKPAVSVVKRGLHGLWCMAAACLSVYLSSNLFAVLLKIPSLQHLSLPWRNKKMNVFTMAVIYHLGGVKCVVLSRGVHHSLVSKGITWGTGYWSDACHLFMQTGR